MAEVGEIAGYQIVATVGQGARSTLYRVTDQQGQTYVLKRVLKRSDSDQRFVDQAVREYEVGRQFEHPRLRRIYRLIKRRRLLRVTEVVVILELIHGETLERKPVHDPALLVRICREACEGLKVMHEAGFVHCDIKPNNIMTAGEEGVKLIDFGQSCPIGTKKKRIQGTPDYIAPEQVKRERVTPHTDVYNFGATMYWLLTGQHPPSVMPQQNQPGQSLPDPKPIIPPKEINPRIPPAFSSLVLDCLQRSRSQRPATMQQLLDRLEIASAQLQRERTKQTA